MTNTLEAPFSPPVGSLLGGISLINLLPTLTERNGLPAI